MPDDAQNTPMTKTSPAPSVNSVEAEKPASQPLTVRTDKPGLHAASGRVRGHTCSARVQSRLLTSQL